MYHFNVSLGLVFEISYPAGELMTGLVLPALMFLVAVGPVTLLSALANFSYIWRP